MAGPEAQPSQPDAGTGLLDRAITGLNNVFVVVAGIALVLMMLHVTLDVVLRAAESVNLIGTLEIVSFYYMLIVVMLPFGFLELRNDHIRVDLFVQLMPEKVQFGLYVLSCLFCLVYFGIMLKQGFSDALSSTQRLETTMSNYIFYIWPARWALPVGFLGVFLAVLLNLLKSLRLRRSL